MLWSSVLRVHCLSCDATALRWAWLLIDTLDEPLADELFAQAKPELASRNAIAPLILVIGATKPADAAA